MCLFCDLMKYITSHTQFDPDKRVYNIIWGGVGLLKNHLLNLRLVDTPASPTKPMPRRYMVAGSGHVGNITVAHCHPIPFLIAGVTPKLRTEVEVEGKIPSGKLGNLSTRPVDEHCRWKI